jgi:hypothetical protein
VQTMGRLAAAAVVAEGVVIAIGWEAPVVAVAVVG